MKKLLLVSVFVMFASFFGCSSMEDDAKKAADLNKESMDYIMKNDLEKAEKSFNESQAIVDKYKNAKDTAAYYNFMTQYMVYLNNDVK